MNKPLTLDHPTYKTPYVRPGISNPTNPRTIYGTNVIISEVNITNRPCRPLRRSSSRLEIIFVIQSTQTQLNPIKNTPGKRFLVMSTVHGIVSNDVTSILSAWSLKLSV